MIHPLPPRETHDYLWVLISSNFGTRLCFNMYGRTHLTSLFLLLMGFQGCWIWVVPLCNKVADSTKKAILSLGTACSPKEGYRLLDLGLNRDSEIVVAKGPES